jgi:hypothetical protein
VPVRMRRTGMPFPHSSSERMSQTAGGCHFGLLIFLTVLALSSAGLGEDKQSSLTFVQITDSHLFDSGKVRPGQSFEEQKLNAIERADSYVAWDWSLLEINRLALSRTVDFVVFTGDFGLEKVTTEMKPPIGCVALPNAVDEVARSFGSLLVNKIYVVRGNNDLEQEDPKDAARFDDFIQALVSDERLKGKQIVNLTPAFGSSASASDLSNGIRIVGLDSSSFKNNSPKKEEINCNYSIAAGGSGATVNRSEYQLQELRRVSKLIQTDGAPSILFTHIPDLDDPYKVDNPPKTGTAAGWNLEASTRTEWNRIIADNRLLAVFAGHLHDATRSRYLPPYSWQALRTSRPVEVYQKTYLAPPLAAKFQMDRAPQARGYLLATVTSQGVVWAEIRWFNSQPLDLLVRPPSQSIAPTHPWPSYWNYIAVGFGMVGAVLLILFALGRIADRRISLFWARGEAIRNVTVVVGSAILSLAMIGVAKNVLGVAESATLITLILVPLIVYGVASGRLTEFKGLGGWGATFSEVASKAVELTEVAIEETVMIEKLGARETLEQFEKVQAGRPVLMTLTLGNPSYDANAVRAVVKSTSQYPEFKFVVFLDEERRVICYTPVRKFQAECERDQVRTEALIGAVRSRTVNVVQSFPGMLSDTIPRTTSNAEALEKMERLGLDAILVVDDNKQPIGVAERQHIINRMVLALAKGAKT